MAPDGAKMLRFEPGPIFAGLVLADEINRATPKTQSALLEAMEEGQVTVGVTTHRLPEPFFVLATQNPLEMEGTYPLPEVQLDRFFFKVYGRLSRRTRSSARSWSRRRARHRADGTGRERRGPAARPRGRSRATDRELRARLRGQDRARDAAEREPDGPAAGQAVRRASAPARAAPRR